MHCAVCHLYTRSEHLCMWYSHLVWICGFINRTGGTFFYGKRKYTKADHSFGLLPVIPISASMRVSAAGAFAPGRLRLNFFQYILMLTIYLLCNIPLYCFCINLYRAESSLRGGSAPFRRRPGAHLTVCTLNFNCTYKIHL